MSINSLQFPNIHYCALQYEHAKDEFHAACPNETLALKTLSQRIKHIYQRPIKTYIVKQDISIPLHQKSTTTTPAYQDVGISFVKMSAEEWNTIKKVSCLIGQIKQNLLSNPAYSNFLLEKLALKQMITDSIKSGNVSEEIVDELSSRYDEALQPQTLDKVRKIARMGKKPDIAIKSSY
jgi:hypothetical protein